jgi:hypothetical protein
MTVIAKMPTLEELSKVEVSDFFNFCQRKKISSVCSHCGEPSMQVAIETIEDKKYLRLLESKIINTNTSPMLVPQYMRNCGNCFSVHHLVAIFVHDDIIKNKKQGDTINDQD